jgi:Uma2 family endonuclease
MIWELPQDFAADADAPYHTIALKMLPALPMTQDQFFEFCQQNRKVRLERTAKGELIIMPPAGGETGSQNASIIGQLYAWEGRRGSGKVFDSSTGFILPSGANRSPDVSWVSSARLALVSPEQMKKFLPLCPDFVVELLSPSDSLRETTRKMEEFMENGARLGWLINPRSSQVTVYRAEQPVRILENPTTVSGDPELPGFILDLDPIWHP